MIDIHCHMLHGIDHDGPGSLEESLGMARIAADDGITTIVATPHLTLYTHKFGGVHERVRQFNSQLSAAGISLTVLPGAEASCALEIDQLVGHTLNDQGYLLLEFLTRMSPQEMMESLYEAEVAGVRPIIAHAERLPGIQRHPQSIADLVACGALVQVTAESLTGGFGIEAKACARYLLHAGYVHLLATDAHSTRRRIPVLSAGVSIAAGIIGDQAAECLVLQNPQAVIQGRALNV